jgi:hypothetical protein
MDVKISIFRQPKCVIGVTFNGNKFLPWCRYDRFFLVSSSGKDDSFSPNSRSGVQRNIIVSATTGGNKG